jgi:hypothetical protein
MGYFFASNTVFFSCQLETTSYIGSGLFCHMKGIDVYSVPHFCDLGLILFSYNRSYNNAFVLLGTRDWLSYNRTFFYIRFSYNRKTLSNNKEQFCRDPARPFLISWFSYIRLSYNRSALYNNYSNLVCLAASVLFPGWLLPKGIIKESFASSFTCWLFYILFCKVSDVTNKKGKLQKQSWTFPMS